MKRAWEEIKRLTEANAQHARKGWRLGDIDPLTELKDAAGEIVELANEPMPNSTQALWEMADVFGCLIGYCVKMGWPIEHLEEALLRKLKDRFTTEDMQ